MTRFNGSHNFDFLDRNCFPPDKKSGNAMTLSWRGCAKIVITNFAWVRGLTFGFFHAEREGHWRTTLRENHLRCRSNQSAKALMSSADFQKSPQPCPFPGRTISSTQGAPAVRAFATKISDCCSGTTRS